MNQTIVTARSIMSVIQGRESGLESSRAATGIDAAETAARHAALNQALLKIQDRETRPDVFCAVDDPMASRLQSALEENPHKLEPLPAGGLEVVFDDKDYLGYGWGVVSQVFNKVFAHPWIEPPETPERLAEKVNVAVLGDWGTGLYGAPECARSIAQRGDDYGLLLHLGDVYYSGTAKEVQGRFLELWPKAPGALSRALNSNHEMYSGGHAYFNLTLGRFGQSSSCVALMNANWVLVGLDTAYAEHDLAHDQAEWLGRILAQAGERKLVLFSHHQPFSRLDSQQGPKLIDKLQRFLDSRRITAWYWGHEHRCVLYDRHLAWGLYGRCVGHGGYPYFRESVLGFPDAPGRAGWRAFDAGEYAPPGLVLDGENPFVKGYESEYGPNGYLSLEFDGPHLVEVVHAADGTVLYRDQIA
jgi:hypothetical protein